MRETPVARPAANRATWVTMVALAAIIAANLAIRAPLVGMPLERDEGEFAYGGQLLLAGEVPYQSLYAMKWPGIYVSYAGIEWLFGQTAEAIHIGLLIVTSWNIAWMYLLGRRLLGPWGGITTAAAMLALGLSPAVEPTSAQAEHFVLCFALPGIFLLAGTWNSPRWSSWLLAGLCLSLAALMKQHGGFFGLVGFVGLAAALLRETEDRPRWWRCAVAYLAGLCGPIALTALALAAVGAFDEFWFWTIDYASVYALHVNDLPKATGLWGALWKQFVPIWPIAIVALCAWDACARDRSRLLMAAFLVASALAVLPAREYRAHYFLLFWPVVALAFGFGVQWLAEQAQWRLSVESVEDLPRPPGRPRKSELLVALLAFSAVAISLYRSADFLLSKSYVELSRTFYGFDPFTEMPAIAEYLARDSAPDDRIAIFGSMPQLFFLSQRRSATGHMYLFPLLEAHDYAPQMQQSMIAEIESARPKYLVAVQDYFVMPYTRREIFDWTERYQRAHYELMGLAIVNSPTETILKWEEQALRHGPKDGYKIVRIYRRRD